MWTIAWPLYRWSRPATDGIASSGTATMTSSTSSRRALASANARAPGTRDRNRSRRPASRLATAWIGQPARLRATPSAVPTAPAPTMPRPAAGPAGCGRGDEGGDGRRRARAARPVRRRTRRPRRPERRHGPGRDRPVSAGRARCRPRRGPRAHRCAGPTAPGPRASPRASARAASGRGAVREMRRSGGAGVVRAVRAVLFHGTSVATAKGQALAASDPFGARRSLGTGLPDLYALSALADRGVAPGLDLGASPVTLKILLENVLRHAGGGIVTESDVATLASWRPGQPAEAEVPFLPARVILQDFTGVPADRGPGRDARRDGRAGRRPGPGQPARAGRPRHRSLGPGRPVRHAGGVPLQRRRASTTGTPSATSSCAGPRPRSAACGSCRREPASSTRSTSSTWRRS